MFVGVCFEDVERRQRIRVAIESKLDDVEERIRYGRLELQYAVDESREEDIAIIIKMYEPAVNPSSVGDEVSGCPAPQNRVVGVADRVM